MTREVIISVINSIADIFSAVVHPARSDSGFDRSLEGGPQATLTRPEDNPWPPNNPRTCPHMPPRARTRRDRGLQDPWAQDRRSDAAQKTGRLGAPPGGPLLAQVPRGAGSGQYAREPPVGFGDEGIPGLRFT
jgi:hypothetical protein